MNFLSTFSLVLVLSLQLLSNVEGIRCFQCNSVNNSGCVNLENYRRQLFYPIVCPDYTGSQAFCRKTVIQVMEKGKHHDPRVIRSCGYIPHKNPCYRADNEGHYEQVCQCFEDGCNSAQRTSTSFNLHILIYSIMCVFITLLMK